MFFIAPNTAVPVANAALGLSTEERIARLEELMIELIPAIYNLENHTSGTNDLLRSIKESIEGIKNNMNPTNPSEKK